jgi:hypothetical protein
VVVVADWMILIPVSFIAARGKKEPGAMVPPGKIINDTTIRERPATGDWRPEIDTDVYDRRFRWRSPAVVRRR